MRRCLAIVLFAAPGCGWPFVRHQEPFLTCDTAEDVIIVGSLGRAGAYEAWCEVGLPHGRREHIDLAFEGDTAAGEVLWRGVVDPASGFACDDIDDVEGWCTIKSPGR